VLMSVSGTFSKEWAPRIGAAGPIVIDNSSAWRMDPDVPLIVPEVNPDDVSYAGRKNIIANPNCSTAQLVVALKPLHDRARIKRVVVATYQSVSGAGKEGMDELFDQTKNVFVLGATPPKKFPKQIAFNVIPFIGTFREDGYTDEEAKMWNEVHKMIDPDIKLTVTCVRVPVMVGHSEAVNIEFHDALDEDEARDLLRESPGLIVIDKREPTGYITPKEAQGEFPVFVSRIRNDPTVEHGLSLWVVADNLRKGAALNAVQIAELLHERGLIRTKTLAA
jgi:aspartate-semialdehyde dehydrogenase